MLKQLSENSIYINNSYDNQFVAEARSPRMKRPRFGESEIYEEPHWLKCDHLLYKILKHVDHKISRLVSKRWMLLSSIPHATVPYGTHTDEDFISKTKTLLLQVD